MVKAANLRVPNLLQGSHAPGGCLCWHCAGVSGELCLVQREHAGICAECCLHPSVSRSNYWMRGE